MKYDLAIIGGGSGGLAMSKRAAEMYGKRVLLVEKSALGGTCVNNGCIPKKMLYNAAFLHGEAKFIYPAEKNLAFNWDEFREKRSKYISILNEMYEKRGEKHSIDIIHGEAIIEKDQIVIGDKRYEADTIVIATGSYAKCPTIPGSSYCQTSDDFFRFKSVPENVCIIGAGYIAIETAFVLAHFGCKVSLIARSKGVLRSFDDLIKERVEKALKIAGISLFDCAKIMKIEKENDKTCILFHRNEKIEKITADKIISAIGRGANTSVANLLDLKKDKNEFLVTNELFQASKKNVYAIGDVTMAKHMLTPVAIFVGRALADHLYNRPVKSLKSLIKYVPTVIFSHPPSGSVGYAENTAMKVFNDCKSFTIEVFHAQSLYFRDSITNRYKFVYGSDSRQIYGIHINGYGCDEIMQGLSVLCRGNISIDKVFEYVNAIGVTLEDYFSDTFI